MNPFNRNKILSHWEQIKKYKEYGETSNPITVEFSLTNKCNHKCPACTGLRDNTDKNSSIDYNLAVEIITQLSEIGVKGVIFTGGGDPLMYNDCHTLIYYARAKGLKVGLITNGGLIKDYKIDNILSCDWIRLSIDAASQETYKAMHGVDTFKQTLGNVRKLVKHKGNTTIGLGFLTCKETEKEIIAFAKLARDLGVDYCQYRPIHGLEYRESINNQISYAKEYYENEKFGVLYSEFKFNTLRGCETNRTYSKCHAANFVTHIAADACVYMCCHCVNINSRLGNLNEIVFKDIWNGKKSSIDNYDISTCMPLCRNDCSNRALEMIINSDSLTHGEFL